MKQQYKSHALFILILIIVNLAVFLPSMEGDFLWDDKYFISENPYIQGPQFLKKFLISPFGGFSGTDENSLKLDRSRQFYRPFTSLSYWLDCKIWGFNPAGFHLTNILVQTINTIILYLILLNLGLNIRTSFFSSLLFSVFPLHFENISWISGRTDLLSFFFASLSVFFFLKFLKRKNYVLLTFSSLLFLSSLLSKENVIFLPAIYFFILYLRKNEFRRTILDTAPFILSLLLWFTLRYTALGSQTFELSGRNMFDFFSTIGFYFIRILFPFDLSFTVDSYGVFKNIAFKITGGTIALLFIISSILMLKRRFQDKEIALVFFSFYLSLLPSVAVIFFTSTVSLVAWRFLYLPSALFLSYFVYAIFKKTKYKPVSIIIVILLFFFYTLEIYPKNKVFGKNETDFWLSFKNIHRESWVAKFNIGLIYLQRDEKKAMYILNSILSQKEHHLYRVYEPKIYEDLAQYYTFKKEFTKAEIYFNRLRARKHLSQHFYLTYAFYLAFQGKTAEGERIVREMLNLFPENHLILINSAKFYVIIENYQKAFELLIKDYKLFPTKEASLLLQKLKEEKLR